jgi:hypothetical protein
MTGSVQHRTLIFLGMVLVITVMIAASLPQLDLKPGLPLPRLENSSLVIPPAESRPVESISINRFIIITFLLLAGSAFVYVFYKLMRGAEWMNLATYFRPMLVICLIAAGILFMIMLLPRSTVPVELALPMPTPAPVVTSPLGPVPSGVLWLVGIGLLVTGGLIVYWIIRSNNNQKTTVARVGLEAEKAWQELKIGLGLKDVIIKCYRQMSLALEKERGIEREVFMTTGEFEDLLEAEGVPHEPIHQLTRLFETARYGNWQPNKADETQAIHCLEAIMLFSRESQGDGLK